MSRVAGYALRQYGSRAGSTLTITEGASDTLTLLPATPPAWLTSLPGTPEGGSNTGREDPDGLLPTLPAPYWYLEDDYILLAVAQSRATASNYPRCRVYPDTVWHDIYPVGDQLEWYDYYGDSTWKTVEDETAGCVVRLLTNPRELDYAHNLWGWYKRPYGYLYDYRSGGYAHCVNHWDHTDYAAYLVPTNRDPDTVTSTTGYDLPLWPEPETQRLRLRHWFEPYFEPIPGVETEGGAPLPTAGEVTVEWWWEWWLCATVWGPTGCDDWTDDGGVTPEPSESVALITDWTGFAYRAYVASGSVAAERRTRPTGAFVTRASITGGTQPALSVRPDGLARCLYVSGADIRARNLDTGEDTYVATGSYPREIWLRHGGLRVLTYYNGGTVYAAVSDAQGNALYGGPVAVASVATAQAFDVTERPDGTLEGWLSVSGTLTQYRSSDNGRTWST